LTNLQSTEEIEIEIDQLPGSVLTKLYNLVLRPARGSGVNKRSRGAPKGTGTGGLKRKSMDEDVEAEKIRALEERMKMFENGHVGGGAPATSGATAHDSEHSSDSSSDESSASESE
jgi:bromodomain-containing factor 1